MLDIKTRNKAKYEIDKREQEDTYRKKHKVTRAKPLPEFKYTPKQGLIKVKKGRRDINQYRYCSGEVSHVNGGPRLAGCHVLCSLFIERT